MVEAKQQTLKTGYTHCLDHMRKNLRKGRYVETTNIICKYHTLFSLYFPYHAMASKLSKLFKTRVDVNVSSKLNTGQTYNNEQCRSGIKLHSKQIKGRSNNIPILIHHKLLKNWNKSQALKRTPKITDTNSILKSALSLWHHSIYWHFFTHFLQSFFHCFSDFQKASSYQFLQSLCPSLASCLNQSQEFMQISAPNSKQVKCITTVNNAGVELNFKVHQYSKHKDKSTNQ